MPDKLRSLQAKRILVTGASGFLGQALCHRLLTEGCKVTALSRNASIKTKEPWMQLYRYDESRLAFAEQDCVVHLAARVHVMNDAAQNPLVEFRAVNVDLTVNLARQAASCGVKRFVFISSVKVNGEETEPDRPFTAADTPQPRDAYGVSKMEAEEALISVAAQTGLEVVIIRPPLVYGPGVRANFGALLRAVAYGIPLPLGAIHNQRSLVALDNLVDLIITCVDHPKASGQLLMVSDGEDLSTPDLIRRMATAMGRPVRLIDAPVWLLQTLGKMTGKSAAVQRLCGSLQVDISKTETLLGWTPPIGVDEGLRRVVSHNNTVL